MKKRNRTKQTTTLEQRLAEQAERLKMQARQLPLGKAREMLLRQAREAEITAHINGWLTSPGLQPPK
jgi:hypothetical protein